MKLLKKIIEPSVVLWWLPLLFVLVLFSPALFGEKIFFNSVFIRKYDMPIHLWFADAFRSGAWTINNLYLAGFPSYISQNDLLHPLVVGVYRLFQPLTAYHGLLALGVLGQWYTLFVLARAINLSRTASVFAAFTWVLSQWNIQWGTLEAMGLFLVTVPFFFLSIIRLSQGKYWYGLAAALATGPFWVMSLTQTTLYLFFVGGLFALFLDFRAHRLSLRHYRTSMGYAGLVLLSILIVAPFLAIDYQFSQLTWRAGGLSHLNSLNDYYTVPDLIHFVSPFFHFEHITTTYPHFFMGILPFLLFILSWSVRTDDSSVRFFRWMSLGVFLTAFQYSPIFFLLSRLPVFNMFRGPGKWLYLFTLGASLLAGVGLDALRRSDLRARWRRFVGVFWKIAAGAGALILFINIVFLFLYDSLLKLAFGVFMRFWYARTLQRDPSYYVDRVQELVRDWLWNISVKNVEFWLAVVSLVLSGILISLLIRDRVSFPRFSKLAVGILIATSIVIWQRYFHFLPQGILKPITTTQFLMERRDELYRVSHFNIGIESYKAMGLDVRDPERLYQYELATLLPNEHIRYGIQLLDGYENFATRRQQFIREFTNQFITQRIDLATKTEQFQSPEHLRMLSMMNVKYILSPVELRRPLVRRSEALIPGSAIPLFVYENPNVLPRAYFVTKPRFTASGKDDDTLRGELRAIADFRTEALIECDICSVPVPSGGGTADIMVYRPGYIEIQTKNTARNWLVVSESLLPGWSVSIDGNSVPVLPANYIFQGVQVPAGDHTVVFSYDVFRAAEFSRK